MEAAGQAKAMTGYVVEYEDSLEDLLSQVMAGVQWKTWRPVYSDLIEHGKLVVTLAAKVSQHFRNQPATVSQLSGRRLRTDLQAERVAKKTWQRACDQALADNPQWIREDKWYTRVGV